MRLQKFQRTDELGHTFYAEAYTEDGGKVWRWTSNNAVCPLDACVEYGIPCDMDAQKVAREKEIDKVLADYRRRMENHVPSAEEMYEMRAAFGEGAEVVNVITGKKIKL